MPLDTVTMRLAGQDVGLETFAHAILRFATLVRILSREAGAGLEWVVDDLGRGSTLAVARGIGDPDRVERVVRRYGELGGRLEANEPLRPYSQPVRSAAGKLRAIVGGRVESMLLETPEREAIVRPRLVRRGEPARKAAAQALITTARPIVGAYGAVEGRVQTLTNRGGLRFTLYDTLEDRAVSCYLVEGSEEIMRDAWGRLASVEGWVSRDPVNGRPITVRRVANVRVRPDPDPEGYLHARGIAPSLSGLLPEQAIRRLRDA